MRATRVAPSTADRPAVVPLHVAAFFELRLTRAFDTRVAMGDMQDAGSGACPGAVNGPGEKLSMRAKTARLTAGLTTIIAGALSFISAITPDAPWRREMLLSFEPGPAAGFAHLLAAVGGVGLVVLGWGIVRGRRRAAR